MNSIAADKSHRVIVAEDVTDAKHRRKEVYGEKFEKKKKNKVEEFQLAKFASLGSLASNHQNNLHHIGGIPRRIRRVSHNPPDSAIISRLFEYGATPKLHSGRPDVLNVQLKQSKFKMYDIRGKRKQVR